MVEETKQHPSCQWLPCNIDSNGMTPVHVYFQESHPPDLEEKKINVASFRGRSIMSLQTKGELLQNNIVGLVINSGGQIDRMFSDINEWRHESSPILLSQQPNLMDSSITFRAPPLEP